MFFNPESKCPFAPPTDSLAAPDTRTLWVPGVNHVTSRGPMTFQYLLVDNCGSEADTWYFSHGDPQTRAGGDMLHLGPAVEQIEELWPCFSGRHHWATSNRHTHQKIARQHREVVKCDTNMITAYVSVVWLCNMCGWICFPWSYYYYCNTQLAHISILTVTVSTIISHHCLWLNSHPIFPHLPMDNAPSL